MDLTAKCLDISYPLCEIVFDASTGQKSLKNENFALVGLPWWLRWQKRLRTMWGTWV